MKRTKTNIDKLNEELKKAKEELDKVRIEHKIIKRRSKKPKKKKDVLRFEKDHTKNLDKTCEDIRNEYFPNLAHAKINYIFRTTFNKDDEGRLIAGEARKLANKDHDLYGYDFEICIHKDTWLHAEDDYKKRLAWHELNHLIVKFNEEIGEPRYDKAGRLVTAIRRHDIVVRTFLKELEMFGPTEEEYKTIKDLLLYAKKTMIFKNRKIKRRKK